LDEPIMRFEKSKSVRRGNYVFYARQPRGNASDDPGFTAIEMNNVRFEIKKDFFQFQNRQNVIQRMDISNQASGNNDSNARTFQP